MLPDGNKRLAIIGETVLRLALADEWYKRSGTTSKHSTPPKEFLELVKKKKKTDTLPSRFRGPVGPNWLL